MNPEADWVWKEVPALRIVDEHLWQAVKARQAAQESAHASLRDGVRKAREMRLLEPAVVSSNFYRLLICADCGADFRPLGRDRYGCVDHYRRKTCGNGKTLQRRAMEMGIRDILAETLISRDGHMEASHDGNLSETRQLRGQIAGARRQLEAVDAKLGGLLVAIEDGLYSTRMKIRFQQLEDRAARLRSALQIDGERLKSLQVQSGGDASREAFTALVTALRTTDDEYAILKRRRMLGPIKVTPGPPRAQCLLEWDREPGKNRANTDAPHMLEKVETT